MSSAITTTFLATSADSIPDLTITTSAPPLHCIVEKPFSNLAQSNLINWSSLFVFPKNASHVKVTLVLSQISKLVDVAVVQRLCSCTLVEFVSEYPSKSTFIFFVFSFHIFLVMIKHFLIS